MFIFCEIVLVSPARKQYCLGFLNECLVSAVATTTSLPGHLCLYYIFFKNPQGNSTLKQSLDLQTHTGGLCFFSQYQFYVSFSLTPTHSRHHHHSILKNQNLVLCYPGSQTVSQSISLWCAQSTKMFFQSDDFEFFFDQYFCL